MSSTVNRAALHAALNLVKPALAAQAYLPILTHVRFDDKGWACAYNDVSAITVKTELALDRCVAGDLLVRALGSFSGESVALQESKDALVLSSGRAAKIKVPTLPSADHPFEMPELDEGLEVSVGDKMVRALQKCLMAVGTDANHPAQMGVTLDAEDDGAMVLYSTDNYTISRCAVDAQVKLPGDAPVVMPTFFCEQVVAMAKAFPKDDLVLLVGPGWLALEVGKSARVFTKTPVDLQPLDFPAVIKRMCGRLKDLKADMFNIPDAFDAAVGRALLVTQSEVSKTTELTLGERGLRLFSTCAMGEADDTMAAAQREDAGPYYSDPSLLARGAKACKTMGLLPQVVVMADDEGFLHLIAHVRRADTK